jgi:chromosomal replication initiator protein
MVATVDFETVAKPLDSDFAPWATDNTPLDRDEIWTSVLEHLKQKVDAQIFAAWLTPLKLVELSCARTKSSPNRSAEMVIAAPHKFAAEHLKQYYAPLIADTASCVLGVGCTLVRFSIAEARKSGPTAIKRVLTDDRTTSRLKRSPAGESNLNQDYTFSNFVVGACNQFAHAVSQQVANNLGSAFNPLFLYGGVGLGKTHLVHAIGNAALRRGKNVLLVSSESFVNELISALRNNRMHAFKSRFRSLDLLIIDDVQFIVGKERTQEEFFHTFNELHQRKRQIILTSDSLPQRLVGLEERLRTRFASGILADLQSPDFETRVAILSKKAEKSGLSLPLDVARHIAEKVNTNIRELEGALNRLVALASMHNSSVSLDLAEEALKSYVRDRRETISVELIQRVVAERHGVSVNDILGKRRSQNIALARQVAMYLSRRLTGCSFPEIGSLFGGRDHSTVIHAVRVVEGKLTSNEKFKDQVELTISSALS